MDLYTARDVAFMIATLFGPLVVGLPLIAAMQIFFTIVGPP
jgi:hypothetical protein